MPPKRFALEHSYRGAAEAPGRPVCRACCGLSALQGALILRAARVQNETAPEKFLNRYEKRFEKREKGSEKPSETRLKNF